MKYLIVLIGILSLFVVYKIAYNEGVLATRQQVETMEARCIDWDKLLIN